MGAEVHGIKTHFCFLFSDTKGRKRSTSNSMSKKGLKTSARRPQKAETTCADKPSPQDYLKRPVRGFGAFMIEGMKKPGDQPLPHLVKLKAVRQGDPREALGARANIKMSEV